LTSINIYTQSSTLWGTWESGGKHNAGSVYSINESGENYEVKYSFPSIIGEWPKGDLCKGKKDTYYGIASGGIYNGGIIFQYKLKTNSYRVLHNFNNSNGRNPQGGLLLINNQLYGITSDGGKNRKGTLYSYNLKNNILTVEHNFNGEKEYSGLGIKSKLTLLGNTLYGVTENGGKYSKGSLYSYEIPTKTFNNHVDFNDSIGTHPLAALIITKSKTIIGTTSKRASHKDGKLFEYNPDTDNLAQLVSFDKVTGSFMQSQMSIVNDSILIGITSYGGNNNAGVIFEYNLKLKKYTPTVHLSKSSTGNISKGFLCKSEQNEIYGLLSEGGQYHCGSLIKYDYKTKKLSVIEIFDKQKAYDSKNGLIFVDKQTLLGLANSGGKNTKYGNIYSINLKE